MERQQPCVPARWDTIVLTYIKKGSIQVEIASYTVPMITVFGLSWWSSIPVCVTRCRAQYTVSLGNRVLTFHMSPIVQCQWPCSDRHCPWIKCITLETWWEPYVARRNSLYHTFTSSSCVFVIFHYATIDTHCTLGPDYTRRCPLLGGKVNGSLRSCSHYTRW